ncbi:unnamed protein product [Staurois parvus]|uniref:Uncharacterized protein n=1 Tax=Staurois parvus TaxID=386267 RepID=A0ABN9EHK7_9NEOB|nr:unnamed protein product [Staurois parvus]
MPGMELVQKYHTFGTVRSRQGVTGRSHSKDHATVDMGCELESGAD